MGGVADCVFHLGPEAQSGKVNHYLRLTPHTHGHTHTRVLLFLEANTVRETFTPSHVHSIFCLRFRALSASANGENNPQNCLALIPKEWPSLRRVMTLSSSQTNIHSAAEKRGTRKA